MNDVLNLVNNLEHIIKKVIYLHENTKVDKVKFIEEKKQLINSVAEHKTRISELEESNKSIRVAKNYTASQEDSNELKIRINEMMREIDRCLVMLNK